MDQKDLAMETEICHNCKREVPQQNYLMHVAHCARNMAVCPVCGDAVSKAHLKDHRAQQHSLVECKDCRHKLQSGAMEHHKATSCGKRVVVCPYCELELPKSEMGDHENYCGARTERCDECGELVMLKYQKLHVDTNHGFLKLDDEPGPTPSWETPITNTRSIPITDLSTLRSTLPEAFERNMNTVQATAISVNKADYKTPIPNEPFRDFQRSVITPYDATEDLRAKVKLVRHDLNEIKQSYLMSEERKDRTDNRNRVDRFDMNVTPTRKTEKFVTNLVPFEKYKSFKVNAVALDENPKNFYNYLGEKEDPTKSMLPRTDLNAKRNVFFAGLQNGEVDKVVNKTPVLSKKHEKKAGHTDKRAGHADNWAESADKKAGFADKWAESVDNRAESVDKKAESVDNGARSVENVWSMDDRVEIGVAQSAKTGATPKKVASPNGAVPKRKEQGATPRRRKAPPPPVNIPPTSPTSLSPSSPKSADDVILPCEFCQKLIPASRLVVHETGCRPDLAQFKVDELPKEPARPNLSPEVQLPCEFCFSLFPASKLLSHQALCDV